MQDRATIIAEITRVLEGKIASLSSDLGALHESIANDTKSSMGDKYETSREMAQQEISRIRQVLDQTKQQLSAIDPAGNKNGIVARGSIVFTTSYIFYIGSAFGLMDLTGGKIFGLGPDAPVAGSLIGLTAGKSFYLNGKDETVKSIL